MKILIIGGGFCGSYCAKKLEKNFDVTLIDPKEYFEFTPSIPHVICDIEHRDKIRVAHKDYLKNTKLILGNVNEFNKDYVKVGKDVINYDYLVLSSGSTYKSPFKSNVVTVVSRSEDLLEYHNDVFKAQHILIIGGGLVGVEMAAELLTCTNKKVTLIDRGDSLLRRNPMKAREYAKNFLLKKGCELIFNDNVVKFGKNNFLTEKGKKLTADFAFICTGIVPNKINKTKTNKEGYIVVDEFLRVSDNVFSGGDVADLIEERTAQNARRHGKVICKNISRNFC